MKAKKQAKPEHPHAMAADACRYVAELIDAGWLVPGTGEAWNVAGEPVCSIGWVTAIANREPRLPFDTAVVVANDARNWPATTKALRALAVKLEAAC